MKKRQQPGSPHCLCETLAQNKWSNRPFFHHCFSINSHYLSWPGFDSKPPENGLWRLTKTLTKSLEGFLQFLFPDFSILFLFVLSYQLRLIGLTGWCAHHVSYNIPSFEGEQSNKAGGECATGPARCWRLLCPIIFNLWGVFGMGAQCWMVKLHTTILNVLTELNR